MTSIFRVRIARVCFSRVSAVWLALSLTLGAPLVWGQATSTSTVTGQVTDQQGAAIAGAEVRLIDTATNAALTTTTNNDGRYVFVNVPVGTFNMAFSKTGFSTSRIQSQQVEVGTTLTVNTSLQIGATSTTVEVQAQAAAELQTTNAAVGTTLSNKAILALPNLGRDVATLAVLQPGVTLGGYTAGAVQDQNTYTLDGGQNTDDMSGNSTSYTTNFTGLGGTQTGGSSAGVVPTPVESVEEFKVTTFNQTADFNNGLGSQVQMVTKRGTNQFHGSAYGYYFATNVGAANSWTNNHTCAVSNSPNCVAVTTSPGITGNFPVPGTGFPLPSNHRDRFGAALGGPLIPKNLLGGKWYFFFNYEGQRFPNVGTYERPVPSDLLRAGVIQIPNSAGVYVPYNLNPTAVPVGGVTYQPASCGGAPCDPRGIGINPVVSQIWNNQMPEGNDPLYASNGADGHNVIGYLSTIRTPLTDNIYVGRIDHDFSDKWHFFASYHFMRLDNLTSNQVDIGGVLPGDTKGSPAATAPRDQLPALFVTGLTTTLSPSATNDFRYSFTRNFWQWGSENAPPQIAGLAGAAEIGSGTFNSGVAESATAAAILIPYNVNTQSVRQRFWDGHDNMFKDDITMIKGNHIVQFGGVYQRNYDFHMRTDNGNGVNNAVVYQIDSNGINFGNFNFPAAVPTSQQAAFQELYSETLGMVDQPQVAYTRAGSTLSLQPIGSVAFERSIIPSYNIYGSDTWHVKPNLTLTYGLSWALELPPYELNGNQVMLVDQNGKPVEASTYLAARKAAALQGQVYNPTLGFETIRNVGRKYPYDPVWTEFSPRVALAWNPKYSSGLLGSIFGDGKTVIRGGYGRIYGRLNGVDLVLTPLLGPGLIQAVSCAGASSAGTCLGSNNVTPANAFRLGTPGDGNIAPLAAASQTLPQPFLPGINGAYAQDPSTLDPNFRPERTDNFTFSIQRAIGTKMTFEAGYIGRIIRNEEEEINIDAVPYMTTLSNQTFAQAYAATYISLCGLGSTCGNLTPSRNVAAQPFFETALGGANSSYCKGFSSCTAALATNQLKAFQGTQVSSLWRAMNSAPSWILGNTMLDTNQMSSASLDSSLGIGNYNALFVTYRARDYHGVSAVSNFTYGRSLGTAAQTQASSAYTTLDPYNPNANYGPNGFDIRFQYNLAITYQPPYYQTQHGVVGHLLGGWTFSPIFTAQSGAIIGVGYTEGGLCSSGCQAFGESSSSGISSVAEFAVAAAPYTGASSANYNNSGSTGFGNNNPTGVNLFSNPGAVYSEFRPCILGYDTSCGGPGNLRGQPTWNVDATALKDIGIWKEGRVGATLSFQITNVLNHVQLSNPSSLSLSSPTNFGKITTQANTPRNMEFGLRIHF